MSDGRRAVSGGQERELKTFRDTLKQEVRLLKQETDMLPRDRRKEAFRTRRERLDSEHQAKERDFIERLNESHESSLQRLAEQHREKIALMEKQFLQQKQQVRPAPTPSVLLASRRHTTMGDACRSLYVCTSTGVTVIIMAVIFISASSGSRLLSADVESACHCPRCLTWPCRHQLLRAKESAVWELEERQIHEKHQMSKHQVKEVFFLQRHQVSGRLTAPPLQRPIVASLTGRLIGWLVLLTCQWQ